jgi:hypothetical protein
MISSESPPRISTTAAWAESSSMATALTPMIRCAESPQAEAGDGMMTQAAPIKKQKKACDVIRIGRNVQKLLKYALYWQRT